MKILGLDAVARVDLLVERLSAKDLAWKVVALEELNKDMVEALRKLQRVTAIDNSFNGPDIGEVG